MTVFHVSPHLWSPVLTIASQMECGVVEFHCDEVLFTSALVEICKSLEVKIQTVHMHLHYMYAYAYFSLPVQQ